MEDWDNSLLGYFVSPGDVLFVEREGQKSRFLVVDVEPLHDYSDRISNGQRIIAVADPED